MGGGGSFRRYQFSMVVDGYLIKISSATLPTTPRPRARFKTPREPVSRESRNDPDRAADRDCVLKKCDRKILPSRRFDQPAPERVAAQRPGYSAERSRQDAANHRLAWRTKSGA